jgi:hypothetical protein
LTRRDALRTIAIGTATTLVAVPAIAEAPLPSVPAAGPAVSAAAPAGAFFTPQERELIGLLAERIIPTDEHSPGALAALVPERIDAVLAAAPADAQAVWRDGLHALQSLCHERFARPLSDVGEAEHDALLEALAAQEERPGTPAERFFVALKSGTVEAYYTSKVGLRDELQYQGNTYLADFPGCTHERHRA